MLGPRLGPISVLNNKSGTLWWGVSLIVWSIVKVIRYRTGLGRLS